MADLGIKVVIEAVDKMTAPMRRLHQTTRQLGLGFKVSEKKLTNLQQQLGQVKQFSKLKAEVGKTSQAFKQAQSKVSHLSAAMLASQKPNQILKNQMHAAKKANEQLRSSLAHQRHELSRLAKSLGRAGLATNNLKQTEASLAQQISHTTDKLGHQKVVAASLSRVTQRMKQMRTAMGKTAREAGLLTAKLTALGGVAAWGFKRQFIDTAAEFERFQTILVTTEGSSEKAKKAMTWVTDFTSKTPYELAQVTGAFVKMRSYGLDPTHGLLKSLGNASAAMGKDLNQAVEAMADAAVGENERLKEFGITAKTVGNEIQYLYTNKQGFQETLTAGKDDREAIQAVLKQIFDSKYDGAMQRLSKTWGGMLSNLSDEWVNFKKSVMDAGAFDFLKKKLRGILETIHQLKKSGQLKQMAQDFAKRITHSIKTLWQFGQQASQTISHLYQSTQRLLQPLGGMKAIFIGLGALLASKLVFAILSLGKSMVMLGVDSALLCHKMLAGFGGVGASLKGLVLGIRAVSVAMMTTPLGLLLTAVVGVTVMVIKFWDRIKTFAGGVVQEFAKNAPGLVKLINIIKPSFVGLGKLFSWVYNLISKFISPTKATSKQLAIAANAGKAFGRILGKSFTWVSHLFSTIHSKITAITDGFKAFHLFGAKTTSPHLRKTISHHIKANQKPYQRLDTSRLTHAAKSTVNHTSYMTIVQRHDEDGEALARRIAQEEIKAQNQAQAAQKRSLLYDHGGVML